MKILYAAIDQVIPGTKGGSVHVTAVAEGLAAIGHDVTVLATPGGAFPEDGVRWMAMSPPFGRPELRWARKGAVARAAEAFRPDVVIERYYNFGGEGILAARGVGALSVLEVNAPVVDYPGSPKAWIDRALVFEPMRRWRDSLCRAADVIVTPHAGILPPGTPASKIAVLEWGADTERFRPGRPAVLPFERTTPTVAVFAGAFRSWHGAMHLVAALRELQARGRDDIGAVFVGDGPERARVAAAAAGLRHVVFAGAVPHARVPAWLAAADIGVAPFDVHAHRPLALGFYWSPLKIFEYMASGLPVVAPDIERLASLVGHEQEGLLYRAGQPGALAAAIERLSDPTLRTRLGDAARERAVREYSWAAHCRALDTTMRAIRDSGFGIRD